MVKRSQLKSLTRKTGFFNGSSMRRKPMNPISLHSDKVWSNLLLKPCLVWGWPWNISRVNLAFMASQAMNTSLCISWHLEDILYNSFVSLNHIFPFLNKSSHHITKVDSVVFPHSLDPKLTRITIINRPRSRTLLR